MKRVIPGFAMLIIPVIAYILLQTGINHYRGLAYFGPKKLSGTFHRVKRKLVADTVYHQVLPFNLTDQNGNAFSNKKVADKIYIANFFFTRCPDVCKKVHVSMDSLLRVFKIHPDIKFISFTVDPAFDTPEVLKIYANKRHADTTRWFFLTGDKSQIYNLAHQSYLLDATRNQLDATDYVHSQLLVLVDANRHIRGYYDGTQHAEWKRLIDELIVLRLEQIRIHLNKTD